MMGGGNAGIGMGSRSRLDEDDNRSAKQMT